MSKHPIEHPTECSFRSLRYTADGRTIVESGILAPTAKAKAPARTARWQKPTRHIAPLLPSPKTGKRRRRAA